MCAIHEQCPGDRRDAGLHHQDECAKRKSLLNVQTTQSRYTRAATSTMTTAGTMYPYPLAASIRRYEGEYL